MSMSNFKAKPLTDYERKVWQESAKDILAHPENYHEHTRPSWFVFARHRLRYEATLQMQDEKNKLLLTHIETTSELLSALRLELEDRIAQVKMLQIKSILEENSDAKGDDNA